MVMLREQKLFAVQQRTKKRRVTRKHQSSATYLKYGIITFIPLILFYKGLKFVTLSNFQAENAGIQGRKYFHKEDTSDFDLSEEHQYEQLLQSRLQGIDLKNLTAICGLPPGASLSLCGKKPFQGKEREVSSPISHRIHILGERHSGTNAAADLAHTNFELSLVSKSYIRKRFPWVKAGEFQKEFGLNNHKHNTQADYGYYPGLSIISIRNPFDWIRSMMRECYFCDTAQLVGIRKGVREFLTLPWTKGAHILPGETYGNIFDLRKKKFCNHLKVAYKRSDCVLIVRAEENILHLQQERFIYQIANMTNWETIYETPMVLSRYLGRGSTRNSFNSSRYFSQSLLIHPELDRDLVQVVRENMDHSFEFALGYS